MYNKQTRKLCMFVFKFFPSIFSWLKHFKAIFVDIDVPWMICFKYYWSKYFFWSQIFRIRVCIIGNYNKTKCYYFGILKIFFEKFESFSQKSPLRFLMKISSRIISFVDTRPETDLLLIAVTNQVNWDCCFFVLKNMTEVGVSILMFYSKLLVSQFVSWIALCGAI